MHLACRPHRRRAEEAEIDRRRRLAEIGGSYVHHGMELVHGREQQIGEHVPRGEHRERNGDRRKVCCRRIAFALPSACSFAVPVMSTVELAFAP